MLCRNRKLARPALECLHFCQAADRRHYARKMHRGATAWANCKLIGVYVVHVGPRPTGTHYQVELVSAELRHLVKAVGWGWVFFLSRLRRADSKLFALLLRTLATESNLTLP